MVSVSTASRHAERGMLASSVVDELADADNVEVISPGLIVDVETDADDDENRDDDDNDDEVWLAVSYALLEDDDCCSDSWLGVTGLLTAVRGEPACLISFM